MASNIKYFHMGPWPVCVGFTRDEKAFKKELDRLGFPAGPDLIPGFAGNAGTHRVPSSPMTFIITMQPDLDGYLPRQIAALIAHEATHVARWFFKAIKEGRPGAEAQAYFVQYVTQCCLEALDDEARFRVPPKRAKKRPK